MVWLMSNLTNPCSLSDRILLVFSFRYLNSDSMCAIMSLLYEMRYSLSISGLKFTWLINLWNSLLMLSKNLWIGMMWLSTWPWCSVIRQLGHASLVEHSFFIHIDVLLELCFTQLLRLVWGITEINKIFGDINNIKSLKLKITKNESERFSRNKAIKGYGWSVRCWRFRTRSLCNDGQ